MRVARERGSEWSPTHAAILSCLLAHRNRHSGTAWPARRDLADFSGCSERTVDRVLGELRSWGAVDGGQSVRASSEQFRRAQYSFPFTEIAVEPCAKNGGSRAPKTGVAVRHSCVARNKEESLKASQVQAIPPKQPQSYRERCLLHPDHGLTQWGTCWGCYAERYSSGTG